MIRGPVCTRSVVARNASWASSTTVAKTVRRDILNPSVIHHVAQKPADDVRRAQRPDSRAKGAPRPVVPVRRRRELMICGANDGSATGLITVQGISAVGIQPSRSISWRRMTRTSPMRSNHAQTRDMLLLRHPRNCTLRWRQYAAITEPRSNHDDEQRIRTPTSPKHSEP